VCGISGHFESELSNLDAARGLDGSGALLLGLRCDTPQAVETIVPPITLTGAIPALIAMWVFDRMDRHQPEPRSTLRKVALAGALSTLPLIFIEGILATPMDGGYHDAAYNGFIVAALPEETAKLLCVYFLVWRAPEFDERLDGIVYAARAGLGFALVENVLYLRLYAGTDQFAFVWIARALLAVPGHAIWAGIMGYFVAIRRFDRVGPGPLGGLLIAVALHGLYDMVLFSQPQLVFEYGQAIGNTITLGVPILIIGGGALALRRLARRAREADNVMPIVPAARSL
jgi:RsiW-degrading membrane proteinase PrsW (M82 family)